MERRLEAELVPESEPEEELEEAELEEGVRWRLFLDFLDFLLVADRFRLCCSFPERGGDRERRRGERERERERRRGEREREREREPVRWCASFDLDLSPGLTAQLAKPGLSGGGGGGAASIWRRDWRLAPDPEPETELAKVMVFPDLVERSGLKDV